MHPRRPAWTYFFLLAHKLSAETLRLVLIRPRALLDASSSWPRCTATMSWQTYVDSNLIGTKKISSAVIVGLDGNTWAASKNFAVGSNRLCWRRRCAAAR